MPGQTRRWALASALALAGCGPSTQRDPRIPAGYPESYGETIAAAEREGVVDIWSSTDVAQAHDLIAGFRARYPRVRVRYADMNGGDIYDGVVARQRGRGGAAADLTWSSAMDLQIKLVNDGAAQRYESPERTHLPRWANWKNQAWGVTAEPIVMVYNRRLIDPAAAPASHLDFRRALEAQAGALDGRVATYDPARSAFGYLVLSQDDMASRDIWRLVRALGANHVRLFATTEAILADVSSGRSAIGYNVAGSYAAEEQRRNPDLAVVLPGDYTLVLSRIAVIPARAPHPNAARLFLDYLLSRAGQRALVLHSMTSVRRDLPAPTRLRQSSRSIRAIRVGPTLLVQQDRLTRQHFMRQWQRAITAGRSVGPHETGP